MNIFEDELKEIIKNLQATGRMKFVDKANEEQITEFENKNGITLSIKHKKWLLFSDGGEYFLPAGIQLYGVVHKPLIDINDDDRPNNDYVVIGALASGDPILCEKNGNRILIYNHETNKIENEETFADFFEFLNNIDEILNK